MPGYYLGMVAFVIAVILTLFWLIVSHHQWREAKVYRPGEDLDGDTRNTIFGLMFVYHYNSNLTWVKHVRYNAHLYKRLALTLLLFGFILFLITVACVSLLLLY